MYIMLDTIDTPPSWAFSFCYYFFIVAILAFVGVAGTAMMKAKQIGAIGVIVLVASALLPLATGMTQFWMCRSSLRQYA
jgi:uncharacterized membrane protein YtjA (UPF0391 family)